jgi:hypothetical protein
MTVGELTKVSKYEFEQILVASQLRQFEMPHHPGVNIPS